MVSQKRLLYVATVLMEISYSTFTLVASLLAARSISIPFVLGLTGSLHVLTRILGNLVFGPLSDKIGRKYLMLFACACSVLAYITLNGQGVFFIFLAYFIAGVANAMFWPLIEAWVGHSSGNKNLIKFLGIFGLAVSGGIILGNLGGGMIINISSSVAIVFGAVMSIIVGCIIGVISDHPVTENGIQNIAEVRANQDPQKVIQQRKYRLAAWIANFATWTTIGIDRFIFPKLCIKLGIPPIEIGFINAMLYGVWFLMYLIMMRFRSWTYRPRPILGFQLLGIIPLVAMGVWPSFPMFLAAFGLFGLTAGMTYFSSMFYAQDGAPDKGQKSGLHEMILGSGLLIGPFFGGAVAQLFSLQAPFLFGALVILFSVAAEIWVLRKGEVTNAGSGVRVES